VQANAAASELLAAIDSDGDGVVSQEELAAYLAGGGATEAPDATRAEADQEPEEGAEENFLDNLLGRMSRLQKEADDLRRE